MSERRPSAGVAEPVEARSVLFEEAPDGIVMADPQGCVVEANRRFCELTGFSVEELRGRALGDVVLAEEPGGGASHLGEVAAGHHVVCERRIARQHGGVAEVEVSVRRLSDGNSIAVVRDVTERRRREAVPGVKYPWAPTTTTLVHEMG